MRFFLIATTSKLALGPIQPPIQCVVGALTPGVKRSGYEGFEADHSPPPIAEDKNAWLYTSTPQYVFMMCLI
jgi:hypothetical protein